MAKNKYSHFFREDMSSLEARSMLFSLYETILKESMKENIKEDRKELEEAYREVLPAIISLELKDAWENQYMC